MKVDVCTQAGWDIISITGPMLMTSMANTPQIFEKLANKEGARVALHLGNTPAMDSGALAALIHLRKQVDEHGGEVVVVAPSEEVRVLFGIVGFEDGLAVFDTWREFERRMLRS